MNEDDRIRAAMDRLREHDRAAAPPFSRVLHRASAARRQRRALTLVGVSAASLAAIILLVVFRPTPPAPWPDVRFDETEPLAFLMQPPSASVTGAAPLDHPQGGW